MIFKWIKITEYDKSLSLDNSQQFYNIFEGKSNLIKINSSTLLWLGSNVYNTMFQWQTLNQNMLVQG